MAEGETVDEGQRQDEFDALARWTVEGIQSMAVDDPIPAACNGSGNPAHLEWLARHMDLGPASLVADSGGGLGGAAAWLGRATGACLVLAEPMRAAAAGGRQLFGLSGVRAWGHQLPFRDGSLDGVLALAVLSTVEEKDRYLAELRRVLRPGGHLGVLEYLRTKEILADPPANNWFVTGTELEGLVQRAGFAVVARQDGPRLPAAPQEWTDQAEAVDDRIRELHPGGKPLVAAGEQRARFARHLKANALELQLLVARADGAPPGGPSLKA
jgi:ubiquinone/menaquinone biosynthesis C-methylase UbiE